MTLLNSLSKFANHLFISRAQIDDVSQLEIRISNVQKERKKVYLNNSKLIDDETNDEEMVVYHLSLIHFNLNSVVLVYEDFLNKLKNSKT